MIHDCYTEVPAPEPPVEAKSAAPGWIFWLALLLALGLFELWAWRTGHPSPSHVLQKFSAAHWWAKIVGAFGFFLLWWHLFLKGPL